MELSQLIQRVQELSHSAGLAFNDGKPVEAVKVLREMEDIIRVHPFGSQEVVEPESTAPVETETDEKKEEPEQEATEPGPEDQPSDE